MKDRDGFDTRTRGTRETSWRAALARVAHWQPTSAPLVVVAPHPDDETLGAGGLIFTCSELDSAITIILVTDGEQARPERPDGRDLRAKELQAALAEVAPRGAHVEALRLPDGGVSNQESQLVEKLLALVPRDALLVAPFEQDGHADHDASGRACMTAAKWMSIPCIRYPIWAWHRLRPSALRPQRLGRLELSTAAHAAKGRAMSRYVSQTESRVEGAVVPPHVLEYFRRPYETFIL